MTSFLLMLPRVLVLAAAWWYEHVTNPVAAEIFDWFYVPLRKRIGHDQAYRIATFFEQYFVPNLLLNWLVWPIAKAHLQAKWNAEIEAQNLAYLRSLDRGAE